MQSDTKPFQTTPHASISTAKKLENLIIAIEETARFLNGEGREHSALSLTYAVDWVKIAQLQYSTVNPHKPNQ